MWLEYILANEVLRFGPEFLKGRFALVFERAYIIDKRIKPHISHVAPIKRNLDTPGQTALRARDAEIADRFAEHCHYFVSESLRPDKVWVLFKVTQQPVLIFAHAEEVVVFFDQLGLGQMIWAFATNQFLLGIEALAAKAVEPTVSVEVDIPSVVDFRQEFLDVADMIHIGRADKVVIGNPTFIPDVTKGGAYPVSKLLRWNSCPR